jgi:hypothetical protein
LNRAWKFRAGVVLLLAAGTLHAQSARYRELRRVVDSNTGFAHMTRGVNMYTLYALRSCVDESDLPVLGDMLRDRDRVTRMAASSVLVDMGRTGKQLVQSRLAQVTDFTEKSMLQESLDDAAKADYRPILEYPLSAAERARIRGCGRPRG